MNIQRGFGESPGFRNGFVTIGNFDGVHRGHLRIFGTLVARARAAAAPSVVFTFDPHPLELLAPDRRPPVLTTSDTKAELLAECGIDWLLYYPTDRALLSLSPREFFDQIIVAELRAQGLVEGENFCFGRGRAGTVDILRQYSREAGIDFEVVAPEEHGGSPVSSTTIRAAISAGDVAAAAELLGRPYRITGVVVRGAARGTSLGFPTANLAEVGNLLPPDGVYAGSSEYNGERYPAAVHLGPNPTFGEDSRKREVHLVGYSGGPLYDQRLSVDLLDRVRGVQTFAGVDAIRRQLTADVERVREIAAAHSKRADA